MTSVYQCDRDNKDFMQLEKGTVSVTYKCANTRRCYWLCRECLKGHGKCSPRCPDYLSVAKVKKQAREKNR
ncbi:MAG: hypothetical protein FJ006_11830 [Chloroflexi bacterium]|nr:hypothetical protein [Chloroflexota bacterium]